MKKYFIFLTIFILVVTSLSATNYSQKDFLKQMQELNDSCIVNSNEGKYYLDANKIYMGSEGIFLLSDYFGHVGLSNLMYDSEGIYTIALYGHWQCDNCPASYPSRPSVCGYCGGTSFSWVDDLIDSVHDY